MEKHIRFYIDLTEVENRLLVNLGKVLSEEMGITLSKGNTLKLAYKAMAKERKLASL